MGIKNDLQQKKRIFYIRKSLNLIPFTACTMITET